MLLTIDEDDMGVVYFPKVDLNSCNGTLPPVWKESLLCSMMVCPSKWWWCLLRQATCLGGQARQLPQGTKLPSQARDADKVDCSKKFVNSLTAW